MKHNKKRNTAFLYECLIKELTKAIVRKDSDRKDNITKIIKENFKKGSALKQDLDTYRSLLETKKVNKLFAERFLVETKKDFQNIDRKAVFNQQTKLIKQINETLSPAAFANFISNYKDIASVGAYLNSNLKAKNRILIEARIVQSMASEETPSRGLAHIDNLTYKTFTNKFNETYGNSLKTEQKDLLMNYIVSFSDNGLGLKSFLNEEISRLKITLGECTKNEKIAKNDAFLAKTRQVLSKLESFKNTPITEDTVKDVFLIQNLVAEVIK
jgi:hypothetical protein